jgi:hypothetical protein
MDKFNRSASFSLGSDAEVEAVVERYLQQFLSEEQELLSNLYLDENTRASRLEKVREKIKDTQIYLARLRGEEVIDQDEARLRREIETDSARGLIAMDTVYNYLRPDIHHYERGEGVIQGNKFILQRKEGRVSLQIPLPGFEPLPEEEPLLPDGVQEAQRELAMVTVTEIARAALGDYAARVMHLLFEIANDYPHWRTPNITFSVNDFLDRLGYARDKRGIHYSKNRRYLMRTLVALLTTQIAAERPVFDKGKSYRATVLQSLITSIRTLYDNDEEANRNLSTWELFEKGVPGDVIQVQIGQEWYEGVRRRDGRPGNNYTLVPRLADPRQLSNPVHTRTEDRLENYLYTRYKELKYSKLTIGITRATALEKAGITTKNVTRATQILQKALDKLLSKGTIVNYNPQPLPLRPNETFTVELSETAFYQRRNAERR